VRRELLKALAQEGEARGLTQSDVAREIGVHRSVISRELRGYKDLTLGRVAELAQAMGKEIHFEVVSAEGARDANERPSGLKPIYSSTTNNISEVGFKPVRYLESAT